MKVLVACEFSGIVRDAFARRGHTAISCDLLPTERTPLPGSAHIQGDALAAVREVQPDLLIAHPPCTYLANSGVRWLYGGKGDVIDLDRWEQMRAGALFFADLLYTDVPRVAVENPIMHRYAREIIEGDGIGATHPQSWWHGLPFSRQTVQPWMFGHPETKATVLWTRGLPPLVPTNDVRDAMHELERARGKGAISRVHYASPGPDRWAERSRTLTGLADAMAEQWGSLG